MVKNKKLFPENRRCLLAAIKTRECSIHDFFFNIVIGITTIAILGYTAPI